MSLKSALCSQLQSQLQTEQEEIQRYIDFNGKLLEEKSRLSKVNMDLMNELELIRSSDHQLLPPAMDEVHVNSLNAENAQLKTTLDLLNDELNGMRHEMDSENNRLQLLVASLNRQVEQLQRNESLINSSYEREVSL